MNKIGLEIVSFDKSFSFHIKMIPMTNLFGNFLCRGSVIKGYVGREWTDNNKTFNRRMNNRFGGFI